MNDNEDRSLESTKDLDDDTSETESARLPLHLGHNATPAAKHGIVEIVSKHNFQQRSQGSMGGTKPNTCHADKHNVSRRQKFSAVSRQRQPPAPFVWRPLHKRWPLMQDPPNQNRPRRVQICQLSLHFGDVLKNAPHRRGRSWRNAIFPAGDPLSQLVAAHKGPSTSNARHAIVEVVSQHRLHYAARAARAVKGRTPLMQDKHTGIILKATKSFLQSASYTCPPALVWGLSATGCSPCRAHRIGFSLSTPQYLAPPVDRGACTVVLQNLRNERKDTASRLIQGARRQVRAKFHGDNVASPSTDRISETHASAWTKNVFSLGTTRSNPWARPQEPADKFGPTVPQ